MIAVPLIVTLFLCAFGFIFGFLGLKPWNKRHYTRLELVQYARDQQLFGTTSTYAPNSSSLYLSQDPSEAHDTSFPIYRVFNNEGSLLQQHCCFESVPGFLDSTRRNVEWSHVVPQETLLRHLSGLRDVESDEPMTTHQNENTTKREFTVLYYWDTTLEYNITKMRTLIRALSDSAQRTQLILVNISNCTAN